MMNATEPSADFERFVVVDYLDELSDLTATYSAATRVPVDDLAAWLRDHGDRPLIAVGAGGSLAVAQLAAHLHERATGHVGLSREPMDLYLGDPAADRHATLLVTASGGHSDSLAACGLLPSLAADAAVFCGALNSAGEERLAGTDVPVFAYPLLPKVHCWVAVNVLLAQAVVLARAFAAAYPDALGDVPTTLDELLPEDAATVDEALDRLVDRLGDVLARPYLMFLYGPDTKTAALDLDSKYTESGLGDLDMSEYRNFAHGRYQTALPRQDRSGLLAMYTAREEAFARTTLDVVPERIAHAGIRVPGASPAAEQVGSLVVLLLAVGAIGRIREIDVGWGSRNTFGDLLYDLDLAAHLPTAPTH